MVDGAMVTQDSEPSSLRRDATSLFHLPKSNTGAPVVPRLTSTLPSRVGGARRELRRFGEIGRHRQTLALGAARPVRP